MNLPRPPAAYSQGDQQGLRQSLQEEDRRNRKRGQNIDLVREEITLLSPSGDRFALVVSDGGILSVEPR